MAGTNETLSQLRNKYPHAEWEIRDDHVIKHKSDDDIWYPLDSVAALLGIAAKPRKEKKRRGPGRHSK